jgi:hypothetical protein
MGKWTAERWAASSGIGFVILILIAIFIPGSPKKYNASAADIASYVGDKHKAILVGGILSGIAIVFFLWFLASFAGTFRDAGERRLSTIMYGAGVVTAALGILGDGVGMANARLVSLGIPAETIKAIYGVQMFVYERFFWAASAFVLATFFAVRRSKLLPDWYAWLSLAGAAVLAVGGLSIKTDGFFSPSGAMGFIAFLVFLLWFLVASILLVQRTAGEPTAVPATSPM